MPDKIAVAILGAGGRMGKRLVALARELGTLEVVAELGRDHSGRLAGTPAVLIDFSLPDATRQWAPICSARNVAMVIGTTGLSDADQRMIDDAARHIPIVQSANMSVGVNVLLRLCALSSQALGADWQSSILDNHHKHKRDAPSGTAVAIARVMADNSGRAPGIASIREGETVGTHVVTFETPDERIALTHEALSRDIFARGALHAAHWVVGREPGRYTMTDVLAI